MLDPDPTHSASSAPGSLGRRPIGARRSPVVQRAAGWLAGVGISADQISLASVGFALLAAGAFVVAGDSSGYLRAGLFVGAAGAIQLRLLANLLDGLVAVEGGRRSAVGEVFNDVPDRVSDVVILVAAGYVAGGPWGLTLGWIAAALAALTAYVRTLGAAVGIPGVFAGPMGKAQRMALLTVACLAAALEAVAERPPRAIVIALGVIVLGCVITCALRLHRIALELERRAGTPATNQYDRVADEHGIPTVTTARKIVAGGGR